MFCVILFAAREATETNKFQQNSNWRSSIDLWPLNLLHDNVECIWANGCSAVCLRFTSIIEQAHDTRPQWMTNRPNEFAVIRFDANSMRCSAISLARTRTSFGQFYSFRLGILMLRIYFRIVYKRFSGHQSRHHFYFARMNVCCSMPANTLNTN